VFIDLTIPINMSKLIKFIKKKCGSKSKSIRQTIWSKITEEGLISAINELGSDFLLLDEESWRLNENTNSINSLLYRLITHLEVENSESVRHSLYNIWNEDRNNIRQKVFCEKGIVDPQIAQRGMTVSNDRVSLNSNPSVPLPEPPKTRAQQKITNRDSVTVRETTFLLTSAEWKIAFSQSKRKMNPGWTKIVYKKLVSCGFRCSVRFKTPHIKRGTRKKMSSYFRCIATCTMRKCPLTFQIDLRQEPRDNSTLLFLVRTMGEECHDAKTETSARHLTGQDRMEVGM